MINGLWVEVGFDVGIGTAVDEGDGNAVSWVAMARGSRVGKIVNAGTGVFVGANVGVELSELD